MFYVWETVVEPTVGATTGATDEKQRRSTAVSEDEKAVLEKETNDSRDGDTPFVSASVASGTIVRNQQYSL